jgi:hypothetical protein
MRKLLFVTTLLLFAGIAFGQTLHKGGIFAVHEATITLNPDVTMNQFVDFLTNKLYPELNKHMEGVTFFLLKGDRGENEGALAWGIYFDSEEVRNKYWPAEGSSSEEMTKVMQDIQPLMDEMNKLGSATTVFTEWKIL